MSERSILRWKEKLQVFLKDRLNQHQDDRSETLEEDDAEGRWMEDSLWRPLMEAAERQ